MTDSRLSSEYYNHNTKIVSVVSISITGVFIVVMGIFLILSIIDREDKDEVLVGNCTCGKRKVNPNEKYLDTSFASYNEFPWHVGIFQTLNQRISCAGVLLSDRYVLTTGSCLETIRNQSIAERLYLLKVVLGEHNVEENKIQESQWFWIKNLEFHPKFNYTSREYDFVVILLSSPAAITPYVYPICLPPHPEDDYVDREGIVSGFATVQAEKDSKETVTLLREVVTVRNGCPRLSPYSWSKNKLCVKGGTCRGDLGSALVFKDETEDWYFLGGLASFSKRGDCSMMGYSRVTPEVLTWIRSNLIGTTICGNATFHASWLVTQALLEER